MNRLIFIIYFFIALSPFVISNANGQDPNVDDTKPTLSDLEQADKFIASLPVACSKSSISAAHDGAVLVHIFCRGNTTATGGVVEIKNGVIRKVP